MVKYANVFMVHTIQALGGVETYLWEIAKKYKAYDVVIVYKEADAKQLDRLKKLVRCIRLNKPIKCKRCFQAYEGRALSLLGARTKRAFPTLCRKALRLKRKHRRCRL